MRIEMAEIGTDVGALVVDTKHGPVVFVDPRLSRREQVRLIASLVSDEEFVEVCSPFPELSRIALAG